MLGRRRRRRPSIKPALDQCLVIAGMAVQMMYNERFELFDYLVIIAIIAIGPLQL